MNPPTLEAANLQFGNEVGVFPFMYMVNARFLRWLQTRVAEEAFRLPAYSACSLFRAGQSVHRVTGAQPRYTYTRRLLGGPSSPEVPNRPAFSLGKTSPRS
jgi:hypothetical protein